MAELLALGAEELRDRVEDAADRPRRLPLEEGELLPPLDGHTEVWAAGVTYERSRSARTEESAQADVYERVYRAARPELFFKAPAWRVVTDGDPVAVRADSTLDVPEPELALVLNSTGSTVGYTVCNDMSSRSIEGENPLYLPQAKVYDGACALATGIRPAWEVPEPGELGIALTVRRAVRQDHVVRFEGATNTAGLHRPLADLVAHLFRATAFPAGAVLATGTGIVPELEFTLHPGDEVRIEIPGVGALTNPVVRTETPRVPS